jgi:hypothetical protein
MESGNKQRAHMHGYDETVSRALSDVKGYDGGARCIKRCGYNQSASDYGVH